MRVVPRITMMISVPGYKYVFQADFYVYNRYSSREEKEEKNMEYLTGVKPKETKEISELLEQAEAGTKVKSQRSSAYDP